MNLDSIDRELGFLQWFVTVISEHFVSREPPSQYDGGTSDKRMCGLSGIMGYVTFHHKTRRGLS